MKENSAKCLTQMLGNMKIGQKLSFPFSRYFTIKTTCSTYGRLWKKKFNVDSTTVPNTIIVTRSK